MKAVANPPAGMVTIKDEAGNTTAKNLEAVVAELYQNARTNQAILPIQLASFTDADGDPLAKFSAGTSTVPGFTLANSKAFGIRWNDSATPDEILTSVVMPQDLDDTADVVLHVMASKTGATVGDAVTFTCTAFFQIVGALHDADANCGGVSSAMTGNATAKTSQEVTLTIAAADVPAAPCVLTLTIQPTDGTLGTDDVIVSGVWLEYKSKIMTS